MRKQLFVYIFLFLISISIVFGNPIEIMKPEEIVDSAFLESKAKLEHVNINSYVTFNNLSLDIDSSTKLCNYISKKLGIKDSNIIKESKNDFCQISLSGNLNRGIYATIIIQSSILEGSQDSSIVIDIIDTREEYEISQLCDKIREILKSYGDVKLNINLTGYYDGLISNKELKEKINKAFEKIGAREIEGIEENNLISITGYTARTDENISYCGKNVNINMAARFNSYENKTYIFIGTPLIVLEY